MSDSIKDELYGVLNAVRVALKFNHLDKLPAFLPRIEEVLAHAEAEDALKSTRRQGLPE